MKIFSMTDVGRKREMNQDYVFATDESLGTLPNLLVVADGMGGHKAGDFASKYTVEVLKEELKHTLKDGPEEILKDAAQTANHKLIEKADEDINLEGMGTTLVAATVIDHTLYFINVGDSRLYLLNKDIRQLSLENLPNLLEGLDSQRRDAKGGMSYEDYLQVLLLSKSKAVKLTRGMNMIEVEIRSTKGKEGFRLDCCIEAAEISVDVEANRKQTFSVTRQYSYI